MKGAKQTQKSKVAILDAGGQYVDLVRKAVERLGYPADMLPLRTPAKELERNYQAVIVTGSPASSHTEQAPLPDAALWESRLPTLGICYGMQALAVGAGGKTARNGIREDGRVTTTIDTTHPLFRGTKQTFTALFTHGDFVTDVPSTLKVIGSHRLPDGTPAYSALARGNKVGVQFHPEVFDDTPEGYEVFRNFFIRIAELAPDEAFYEQRLRSLIKTKREAIKRKAAGRTVIAFMSGGVDSSVAGALAAPVTDLIAFYIDNGFMRDEDEKVIEFLKRHTGMKVQKIDASEVFAKATITLNGTVYGPLETTADPQLKRRIIGKTFIDVQNDIIADLGLKTQEVVLLQGTNAADRIESGYSVGDNHTETIKTHHNLVPEARKLNPIEPLDDLFKDEIRALGAELSLPDELVWRQPFPGPGLAIRILQSTAVDLPLKDIEIQHYLDSHSNRAKLAGRVLPVQSVGVGGDERSHLAPVALQGKTDWRHLAKLAGDIPAHFRGKVNRVIYALSDVTIASLKLTNTTASAPIRAQLRHADRIVFEEMRAFDLLKTIAQFPVVLLPVGFGRPHTRSIVLRPVTTSTFMTVQAMLPGRDLPEAFIARTAERILAEVPGITQVFLDLTNKPPGTTEWE